MVGFESIVTFNNNGSVRDKQKAFHNEYDKKLIVFLPLSFNNKKRYRAELSTAFDDTYPKRIVIVAGEKSETDLNCYTFELSEMFQAVQHSKVGLSKVILYTDKGRKKFESELFRIT